MYLTSSCLTTHLQTWGFNKGGIPSTNQAVLDQLGPPRDTKNCDVCHAGGRCVAPVAIRFRRCKLVQLEQCSWAPTERRSVLCGRHMEYLRFHLQNVSVCFGVHQGAGSQVITTQSNTIKGSRLQKWGHVSASILACTNTLQSNSEPK